MFSKLLNKYKRQKFRKPESGDLTEEINDLIIFFEGRIKDANRKKEVEKAIKEFFRQPYETQLKNLAGLYLFLENCLKEENSKETFSNVDFRRGIQRRHFPLLHLSSFSIIFQEKEAQEKWLCKQFLILLLEQTTKLLGQGQDNFFGQCLDWVQNNKNDLKTFPFFDHPPTPIIFDSEYLVAIGHFIFQQIQKQFGPKFTAGIYDQSYQKLANQYKMLEIFPVVISLLPEAYRDSEKISIFSKHQLTQALLEKVKNLESLNIELGQKNKALKKSEENLKLSQKETKATLHQLTEVMNAIGEGIITANEQSQIIQVNKEVEKIFGYEAEELKGKLLTILMPKEYEERHLRGIDKFLETKSSSVLNKLMVMKGVRKDGDIFPLEINVSSIEFDGKILFTAALRDISQQIKMEQRLRLTNQQLKTTNQELRKSNEELEQFAYVASHDLQEPLRTIASYVQLIQRRFPQKTEGEVAEYIAFAVGGVKRLQKLIQDLLEYSRVGKKELQFQKIALSKLIDQTKLDMRAVLEEKNAKLELLNDGEIVVDSIFLQQIFQNLFSNALKFSEKDTAPHIKIKLEEYPENWQITVEDNGIGIAPGLEKKIFDLFQRLHNQAEYEGTGIGLAICKRIIEKHGGKIWIDNNKRTGTTFCFTIDKNTVVG